MTPLYLFRPLRPTSKYPRKSLDLHLNGVRYDLPLPARVWHALKKQLSADGPFNRQNDSCCPKGMSALRADPRLLKDNFGTYAEAEESHLVADQGMPTGHICQQAAANAAAAKQILWSSIDGETFPFDVVMWLFQHADRLDYSGGFEIARAFFFTNAFEMDLATAAVAGAFDELDADAYRPPLVVIQSANPATPLETCP